MSTLALGAAWVLGFAVAAALLVAFQNHVRVNAPSSSAPANIRRCLWVAFVIGAWWPWAVFRQWSGQADFLPVWASLEDHRLFLIGASPTLWVVGFTSVVQPWVYSIRTWLLGANLLAIGLFYGLFVGTVEWPGNLFTYQWLFWSAVGFGLSLRHVIQARPGQSWADASTTGGKLASNGHAGGA